MVGQGAWAGCRGSCTSSDPLDSNRQTPEKPASLAVLQELGVLYWRLDADKHETDPRLAAIRKIRNYSYVEIISISKDTLPGYEQKIKTFYEEHIHADEEIRFILDGAGANNTPVSLPHREDGQSGSQVPCTVISMLAFTSSLFMLQGTLTSETCRTGGYASTARRGTSWCCRKVG